MSITCRICLLDKDESQFPCRKSSSTGRRSECKQCIKFYNKKYSIDNFARLSERKKEYKKANKEACAARDKKYAQTHAEKVRGYKKKWDLKNKAKKIQITKDWAAKNRDRIREREQAKRKADPEKYRLIVLL